MRRIRLAGLNCREILPKTIASCLGDVELPYNWSEKMRGVVLGICLARSTVLQDIARMRGGKVKKTEKELSEFLGHDRLDLRESSWNCSARVLRRIGRRRFFRYRGKLILLVDSTTYAKLRSRGKEHRMPHIGHVPLHNVPGSKKTILAPGYNEFWTGLLLKDETCLGITRRLFTETMLPGASQNTLEEIEIRKAIELVRETFDMDVIIVADRGFRRKDLLAWLKKEQNTDFVIRLQGKLTVTARGWNGLLHKLAPHWPERLRRYWRDGAKDPILSAVRGAAVKIPLSLRKSLSCNIVCLTPINRKELEPMLLGTTLPIETRDELSFVVRLYSLRWTIETFFFSFKRSLRAGKFRVFSCWEAVDHLLAMAHMAFLVLHMLFVLGREARAGMLAELWYRVGILRHAWFARPTKGQKLALGQFFDLVAQDCAHGRWAGVSL